MMNTLKLLIFCYRGSIIINSSTLSSLKSATIYYDEGA